MLIVLLAMVAGLVVGFVFKDRKWVLPIVDRLISAVIRLLLFLLGFGIGRDKELLAQVPELGLTGFALAVAAIAGSVIAARIMLGRKTLFDEGPIGGQSIDETLENNSQVVGGAPWHARILSMRGSLLAVAAFGIGMLAGYFLSSLRAPDFDATSATLYFLMFLVGISAGSDPTAFGILRKHGFRLVLLPFAVIVGSLGGAAILALFVRSLPMRESLAVAAGFGYYSLSSLILRELSGGDWATVALLSNISREIITLLTAPLLARYFGPAAPAASGAATSMDTTLAATVEASGRSWAVPALFSGVVLTLLTPVAVTLIMVV